MTDHCLITFLRFIIENAAKREPAMIIISNFPFYYLFSIMTFFLIYKKSKESVGTKATILLITYYAVFLSLIIPSDILFFLAFFIYIHHFLKSNKIFYSSVLSSISSFFRIDGVFLSFLLMLHDLKKKKSTFLNFLPQLLILITYFITSYTFFGNPAYHAFINTNKEGGFLNMNNLIKRVYVEPFTVLTGALGFTFVVTSFLIERTALRIYFLVLILLAFLNPQMGVEIGRWGAPQAIYIMLNNKKIRKIAERNFFLFFSAILVHTILYGFLRLKFLYHLFITL